MPDGVRDLPTGTVGVGDYGIHVLEDKDPNSLDVVDIVAIHGLNGHYESTWTTTQRGGSSVNWLRDLLPKKIPNARIMTFSYNSKVQFSKSTSDVFTFADQFLEQLLAVRKDGFESSRPILFICHSLGGIVFKQAANRAYETERYACLSKHFVGVAFFGTPHRGSDIAQWATILGTILKVGSLGSGTNSQLAKDLERKSRVLDNISSSFVNRGKNLTIFSFYETEKMEHANFVAVDKDSATLGWPSETRIPIDGDHRSICRFYDINESKFRPVWRSLSEMASQTRLLDTAVAKDRMATISSIQVSHFRTSDYDAHKDRNPDAVEGTCIWIFQHEKYQSWVETPSSSLLWISADAGCGKSVLASFLVDHHRQESKDANVCFFFFKADNNEQNDASFALSAILHQLYTSQPQLLDIARRVLEDKPKRSNDVPTLWAILQESTESSLARPTICIIDGLDECEEGSRKQLTSAASDYFSRQGDHSKMPNERRKKLKLLVTSRPENSIKVAFDKPMSALRGRGNKLPKTEEAEPGVVMMRLRGEDEIQAISSDIELVVRDAMKELTDGGLPLELLEDIERELITQADRTFLWTTLIIQLLKERAEEGASRRELEKILYSRGIDAIYTTLLDTRKNQEKARKMLSIILAAARPLTIEEMSIALAIRPDHQSFEKLKFPRNPSRTTLERVEFELVYPFENHIKALSGSFVRVIQGRVYLVHQTAREFLLDEKSIKEFLPPKPSWLQEEDRLWLMNEELENEKNSESGESTEEEGPDQPTGSQSTWHHSISHINANGLLLEICVTYLYMLGKKCRCATLGRPSIKTAAFLEYAAKEWANHFHVVASMIPEPDLSYYHGLCHPSFPGYKAWVQLVPYGPAALESASAISADDRQDFLVKMLKLWPNRSRYDDLEQTFLGSEPAFDRYSVFSSNPGALENHSFPVRADATGRVYLDIEIDRPRPQTTSRRRRPGSSVRRTFGQGNVLGEDSDEASRREIERMRASDDWTDNEREISDSDNTLALGRSRRKIKPNPGIISARLARRPAFLINQKTGSDVMGSLS